MNLVKKVFITFLFLLLVVLGLNNSISVDIWENDRYPVLLKPESLKNFIILGLYAIIYLAISAIDNFLILDDEVKFDRVLIKYFLACCVAIAIWNFLFSFFFTF